VIRTLRTLAAVAVATLLVAACATAPPAKGDNTKVAAKFRDIGGRELAIGQNSAALQDLLHARELDPNNAATRHLLGLTYLRLGRYAEAEASIHEALRIDPNMGAAHNTLGSLYSLQHKDGEAVVAYRAALAAPGYATPEVAHANLGRLYARQGDDAAAATELRAAMQANPTYQPAYVALAGLMVRGGRTAEARTLLDGALTRFPASARIRLELGKLLIRSHDYRAALHTLKEGQRLAQDASVREAIARQIDILE